MALPTTSCPDGAGSLNNPANEDYLGVVSVPAPTTTDPNGTVNHGGIGPGSAGPGSSTSGSPAAPYVPPELCVGEFSLGGDGFGGNAGGSGSGSAAAQSELYQEQLAAESLNISGAPLNVFMLLGVHNQGKLVDLVGTGSAMNGTANVFAGLAGSWVSPETGVAVVTTPSWIGYDFGITKTSYGQAVNAPGLPNSQHITSLRIVQPATGRRALQIRVDRSNGGFHLGQQRITGTGNGTIVGYTPGPETSPGSFMLTALSPTVFSVVFTGASTVIIGVCTVGVRYNTMYGSFTVQAGTVPFAAGDLISVPIEQEWYRVDVINLLDVAAPILVRLKQSSASRYWRITPTSFSGAASNEPWEVDSVELFDFQTTRLDDVQDALFLENRDRDYAKQSVQFKVTYSPFDAISDLSKFGFQVADTYTFTTVFSTMVKALGRPIVVGDVLEVPSEMQYDHNLKPVRKFLEVTDTSWAADGYSTAWKPITFRFQASQLIPSQEHRSLLGTVDTQKYIIDNGDFFAGIEQIQTGILTANEAVNEEARQAVPEKGSNVREVASGTNRFGEFGTYDGVGPYVEDGLPPDGLPYTEGFKLPDVGAATDGDYYRLNYDPKLNIPARLYKFSAIKNRWIYVETDRRSQRNSFKPSQQEIFNQPSVMSLTAKKVT